MDHPLNLTVDGQEHTLAVDPRTTLLDALRDRLGVMSPKKGCDAWSMRRMHGSGRRPPAELLPGARADP